MNASQFAKARDRLMSEQGRGNNWRRRAMDALVRRAAATPLSSRGGRVMSYRLPNGQTVCTKHRYASERQAVANLAEIRRERDGRRKPIRAYPCFHCLGWHLTSMA